MNKTKISPTIQDVARYASVSTATVSRALSAPDRVSDRMREKVDAAVLATGYTLNQTARSLRMKSTRTILVALPNISNPFFSPILNAIEEVAMSRGYSLLVTNSTPGNDSLNQLRAFLHSHRADGLLLLNGALTPADLRSLFTETKRMPLVNACEEIPNSGQSTVRTDNRQAAARATQHLIGLGHKNIAHLTGPLDNILGVERQAGFLDAMREAQLSVEPDLIYKGSFSIQTGVAAARHFFGLKKPPTAIFSGNDSMAFGLLAEANELGFKCPDDFSVIGFDDIELSSSFIPPLTTMHQPTRDIGLLAAQTLLDQLEDEDGSGDFPKNIVLESTLVVRGSTARLS